MTRLTRSLTALLAFTLLGSLAACGSASNIDEAVERPSGADSTTDNDDLPATTNRLAASPDDIALVAAANLDLADFGEGWTKFSDGKERPIESDCAYEPGSVLDGLGTGAYEDGPIMTIDNKVYVSSRVAVFASPADATRFLAVIDSDEWAVCYVASVQEAQNANDTGATVTLKTREAPGVSLAEGESYAELEYLAADGSSRGGAQLVVTQWDRAVQFTFYEFALPGEVIYARMIDEGYAAQLKSYERFTNLL